MTNRLSTTTRIMELFKSPTGRKTSPRWAFLLVYLLLLSPIPITMDTDDNENGRSLTNEQPLDSVDTELLENMVLINEHERGGAVIAEHDNGQELDILPVVTTPPPDELLSEEPPRLAPPINLDVPESEESLNLGGFDESQRDHVTSHDQDGDQQDLDVNDLVPLTQTDQNAALSLDDNVRTDPDTPPIDGGGILIDSDTAVPQSHDQEAEPVDISQTSFDKHDLESEEATKMKEEVDGQLPQSTEEVKEAVNVHEDDGQVVTAGSEEEGAPPSSHCGELDSDCQQTERSSEETATQEEEGLKETDGEGVGEGDEGEMEEEGKEEEDDVPSFEEFKQKMMEQSAGQQQRVTDELNSLHLSSQNQNKNFASLDCGAKVIETNPGAQNPSSILDENKDKYMINTCSSKIWFIVQLCEMVSVRTLEIASFELFSSTPQSFIVYCAERYPTDNWFQLGTFLARNERSVQSFPLIMDENVYANYIKVEMVSHYGDERYCPLSLFRVLGASMIEVYEESEQNTHSSGSPISPSLVLPPSEGFGEDEVFWEIPGGTDEEKNGTLLHRAKDAVLRVINKFFQSDEENQDENDQLSSATSDDANVTNTTNTSAPVTSGGSKGCGHGEEGCVEDDESDSNEVESHERSLELNTRAQDKTAASTESADLVDVHHHGNSVEESRQHGASEPESPQSSNHQTDADSEIETTSSKLPPSQDDSISTDSQSIETNQKLATAASGDPSSEEASFSLEKTNEETVPQSVTNNVQETTDALPAINPTPPHTIDTPSIEDSAAVKFAPNITTTVQQQTEEHGDSLPETPPPSLASPKTDSNETEKQDTDTSSSTQEDMLRSKSLDNDQQEQLKIDSSLTSTKSELNLETQKKFPSDTNTPSPLGPEDIIPIPSSTVSGEIKPTPPQEEAPTVPSTSELSDLPQSDSPPHTTDMVQPNFTPLPSGAASEPYATLGEHSTINGERKNSVSNDDDQTSDYSNDLPDLSGQEADGTLLTPAQNTTSSHINASEVINASLDKAQIDGGLDGRGLEEFDPSPVKLGGSNDTDNEASLHPHIPSAAVDDSSRENGTGSDHTHGWNASNLSENNEPTNAANSPMNIIDPSPESRPEAFNASVGVNSSNKTNASLSASSEGGSGTPSHGANGNGGAHYLGSLPPREKEKSVFLRLSNHIKELEVNMSIFSSYLDQISTSLKRNKNRTEEATRALDKKITWLNESLISLKDEASLQLLSLRELNQELQQLTSAMADLTTGLDSLSHSIFSRQNLLATTNMMAILSLSLILCVWYCCSHLRMHRELAELKMLIATIKSDTTSSSSNKVKMSKNLPSSGGTVLHNGHMRSSSASKLSDLRSVRGIGELSQSHLKGFDQIGGISLSCHGDEVEGMTNGLLSHSLSSLDDHRGPGNEMWKVIDNRRKKKTRSKQKT